MPVSPRFLSEAQMEIMNVVWERGEVTVADVWTTRSARRKVSRTTILTMLTRLEEKGWLSHEQEGRAFRYRAIPPRDLTLGVMVRRSVDTAFGGSVEALLGALLHGRGVSKEEARAIEGMCHRAKDKASYCLQRLPRRGPRQALGDRELEIRPRLLAAVPLLGRHCYTARGRRGH